jgi:hypothetical protein
LNLGNSCNAVDKRGDLSPSEIKFCAFDRSFGRVDLGLGSEFGLDLGI